MRAMNEKYIQHEQGLRQTWYTDDYKYETRFTFMERIFDE